jgi:hypothetical protein
VWLHWEWDEYVQLFGTNQRRLDLLNETAPALFTIVQECLWEAVLLHLARLTDPITVAGKETLTLHRLRPLVKPPFRETVQQHLDDVTNKTKFARDWRNRHIGHRELSLALQDSAKPLEPASRQAVSEAIAAVAILLNAVESHYCQSEVAYKYSTPFGNAEALLHSLRAAQHAIAKRDRRFEEGDWNPPEWEREPV